MRHLPILCRLCVAAGLRRVLIKPFIKIGFFTRQFQGLGPAHDVILRVHGIAWSGMIILLIVIGSYAFFNETFPNSPDIEVEPLHVPQYLADAGITPRIAAQHLIDKVEEIHRTAASNYESGRMKPSWPEAELELPATGVSIQATGRYLRSLYHRSFMATMFASASTTVVTGELIDTGRDGVLSLHLRLDRRKINQNTIAAQQDRIFERGALRLVEAVEPYILAAYNYSINEYAAARELSLRIVRNRKDTVHELWAHNLLGLLDARDAQYRDAFRNYEKAIALHEEFAPAYHNWGSALFRAGKLKEAMAKYEKAASIRPDSAETYYNWGNALAADGKYAEAITKYRKAIELKPQFADAYFDWGTALFFKGDQEGAMTKYREVLKVDSGQYEYLKKKDRLEKY